MSWAKKPSEKTTFYVNIQVVLTPFLLSLVIDQLPLHLQFLYWYNYAFWLSDEIPCTW